MALKGDQTYKFIVDGEEIIISVTSVVITSKTSKGFKDLNYANSNETRPEQGGLLPD